LTPVQPSVRGTFVKICGITRLSDARAAVRAGANAIGLIFAPSPRRVSISKAALIAQHIHPSVRKIGVFVDADPDGLMEIAEQSNLDGVQLQGAETPEDVRYLKKRLGRRLVFKVIRLNDPKVIDESGLYEAADAVFFDRKDVTQPGSVSRTIPLSWLMEVPMDHIVIAGGLNASNVGRLVRTVRPWGVDVSAGVEQEPGKKDPELVKQFIRAVRRADAASK